MSVGPGKPGVSEISGMPGITKVPGVSGYSDAPAASWVDEIRLLDVPRMTGKSGVMPETKGALGIPGRTRCTTTSVQRHLFQKILGYLE
ncbi:hypothetical protein K0M31_006629 [Melipona bicolor]|uniref:Uncharacterized protein n=1 Tax=Melipona bicolor TaxID=60889 RepID=A0AA40FSM4_9HYME|nr:hypothetical protein K0M31_006629 [Melipona bicolor]